MAEKIVVSGIGCCLVDLLYNNIDFSRDEFRRFLSEKRGDGGLAPGKLVFADEFERFSGISLDEFIDIAADGRECDRKNIGGPSVVALIHAAQLLAGDSFEVRFSGRFGKDNDGSYLVDSLKRTPLVLSDFKAAEGRTPSTMVLSDPWFDNGHGERLFINSIGAAWNYTAGDIRDEFFGSDITVFGGTALVPCIHDNLSYLLKKARGSGCMTVVNTVFDFRNERLNPDSRWPLGDSDESYRLTDLLITDREEALRLSGRETIGEAAEFFISSGLSSFIITNGSGDVTLFSDGRVFSPLNLGSIPVSDRIREELRSSSGGDTTGCGDNFCGGVIASIALQMKKKAEKPDFLEAASWGVVSGGFTCFYMGGTWFEKSEGEKLRTLEPYYESYRKQLSGE